jgi:hypothetical protein
MMCWKFWDAIVVIIALGAGTAIRALNPMVAH